MYGVRPVVSTVTGNFAPVRSHPPCPRADWEDFFFLTPVSAECCHRVQIFMLKSARYDDSLQVVGEG